MNLDWLVYLVDCSNVSTTNVNQKGVILCYHWGCKSIYEKENYEVALKPKF